jgi:hypothetical protein
VAFVEARLVADDVLLEPGRGDEQLLARRGGERYCSEQERGEER